LGCWGDGRVGSGDGGDSVECAGEDID
jgi:hypothetical protein